MKNEFRPYFSMALRQINTQNYYEIKKKREEEEAAKAAAAAAVTTNPYQYTPSTEDKREVRGNALMALGGGLLSSLDPSVPGGVNWGGLGAGVQDAQNVMLGMHDQLAKKHAQEALWKQETKQREEDVLARNTRMGISQGNLDLGRERLEYDQLADLREDAQETLLLRQEFIGARREIKSLYEGEFIPERERDRLNIILDNDGPEAALLEARQYDPDGGREPVRPTHQAMEDERQMRDWYAANIEKFPLGTTPRSLLDTLYETEDWSGMRTASRDETIYQYNAYPKMNSETQQNIQFLSREEGDKVFNAAMYKKTEMVYREGLSAALQSEKYTAWDWAADILTIWKKSDKKTRDELIANLEDSEVPLDSFAPASYRRFTEGSQKVPVTVAQRTKEYVRNGKITTQDSLDARTQSNGVMTEVYADLADSMNSSSALRRTETQKIREKLQITHGDLQSLTDNMQEVYDTGGVNPDLPVLTETINAGVEGLVVALQKRGQLPNVPVGTPFEALDPLLVEELTGYLRRIWSMYEGRQIWAGY